MGVAELSHCVEKRDAYLEPKIREESGLCASDVLATCREI